MSYPRRMLRWFSSSRIRHLAGVVVVVLGTVFVTTSWVIGRAEDLNAPTAWSEIMAMVEDDGTVGLDMAKQAFAFTYADLPGVKPPAGRPGPRRSGSAVASWILAHWNELSPKEQGIVADALGLEINQQTVNGMRLVSAAAPALNINDCSRKDHPSRKPAPTENDWPVLMAQIGTQIESLLGVQLNAQVQLCFSEKQPKTKKGADIEADMLSQYSTDDWSLHCQMTVFREAQKFDLVSIKRVLAHELMHCFERRIARHRVDANGFVDIPPWIDEGSANWVAYRIAGIDEDLAGWADVYMGSLHKSLLKRSYDAFMYFEHVDDVRGNVAELLKDVIGVMDKEYTKGAYYNLNGNPPADVLNTHPSSWLMDKSRGQPVGGAQPWFLELPGSNLGVYPFKTMGVAPEAAPAELKAGPYGANLIGLVLESEVIMVRSEAYGRFSPDGHDYTIYDAASKIFCTKQGGCTCKDGSKPSVPFTNIAANRGHIAITGGAFAASAQVVGYTLDRFCREKPKPQNASLPDETEPPGPVGGGGGCQGSCGGSNGDPHLNTFDNLFYDLQSVGEYTLTAAPEGDLEVQARTAPVKDSTTASINVAFAMRVGADRVGFYLESGKVVVRLNGTVTEVDRGETKLPGGGKLTREAEGGSYAVAWPDGTKSWVYPVQDSLTLQVSPAEARKGKLIGLLGDHDGDQTNDLKLRDGTPMPGASFTDLHTKLVDGWRVTAATSLFDYEAGQSTDTFTDRSLPTGPVTAQDSPNRVAAEAACREAGVTDPVQLNNCIIDVGVTGNPAYAAGSAAMQRFLAKPVGPGETVRDGNIAGGTIATATQKDRFPLDLGGAKGFYIAGWTGPSLGCDQSLAISIIDVTYDHRPCSDGVVRFGVPDPNGRYEVEIAGVDGKTGRYQFELVTIKTRDFTVKVGGRATGQIDVRGRMDVYTLDTGGATKFILTDAPECTARINYELINLTTGQLERSPRSFCRDEEVVLPDPNARYAIGITSATLTTAAYKFRLQGG